MRYSLLFAGKDDLREVNDFLVTNALKAKDCLPPPMLDIFCVAHKGDELVACCGASVAREGDLHLEGIYKLDETVGFLLGNRSQVCEIGRWFSLDMNSRLKVIQDLIEYLLSDGVKFALCELKDSTVRLVGRYGLNFKPTASVLNLSAIDPAELDYYEIDPPRLYVLDLRSIEWK